MRRMGRPAGAPPPARARRGDWPGGGRGWPRREGRSRRRRADCALFVAGWENRRYSLRVRNTEGFFFCAKPAVEVVPFFTRSFGFLWSALGFYFPRNDVFG